jgi:ABC-type branched-subunit amino acid transport system ATPase component
MRTDSILVLEVQDLKKAYGETVAVDGVSFAVRQNEIVGLLGPNGAGKTTTINMILGVLEPTGGSIRIGRSGEYSEFGYAKTPQRISGLFFMYSKLGRAFSPSPCVQKLDMARMGKKSKTRAIDGSNITML